MKELDGFSKFILVLAKHVSLLSGVFLLFVGLKVPIECFIQDYNQYLADPNFVYGPSSHHGMWLGMFMFLSLAICFPVFIVFLCFESNRYKLISKKIYLTLTVSSFLIPILLYLGLHALLEAVF